MSIENQASVDAQVNEINEATDASIAQSINDGLKYSFLKDLLVKPLPVQMIEKVVTTQIPTGETDEAGFNLYETQEEIKSEEADYREGIVISLPSTLDPSTLGFGIGDTVVFHKRYPAYFDLFKDSMIVKPYDIIAVVKK